MDAPHDVNAIDAAHPRESAGAAGESRDLTNETGVGAPDPSEDGHRWTLGLILLGASAAFWPTLASFPSTWNAPYQEHGFFVGGLVLWLLWRDRRRVVRSAGSGIADLVPVIGLLSVAWLFAVIMNVRVIHQLLFWAIATAGALAIFGWRARVPILVTSATSLLAIPFWSAFIPILQRMTTIMSGGIAKLGGVEAVIREDTITISAGTFLVDTGCSGINYLMGGLVLGAFYAHLFAERWQTQLKIVALAGGMSIIGNWIRVAVLVFLGEATAMQSPYIEDHLWQGWAIFTLLMIPAYFLARKIEERDARKVLAERSSSASGCDDGSHSDDVVGKEPVAEPVLRRRAVRVAAVALVGPAIFFALGTVPRGDALERDPAVFGFVEGWSLSEGGRAATQTSPSVGEAGQQISGAGWLPDYKGWDEVARWTADGPAGTIQAARLYFVDQRQGEELIQYDNYVAADSLLAVDRLFGPVGPDRRFVREAVVLDGDTARLVWYWYRVAGFDTASEAKAKLLEVLAFFRRSPAAELLAVHAECAPQDCTEAALKMRTALGAPAPPDRPAAPDADESDGTEGPTDPVAEAGNDRSG